MSKSTNTIHFEWSFAEDGAAWPDAEVLPSLPMPKAAFVGQQPSANELSSSLGQATPLFQAALLLLITLLTAASGPAVPQRDEGARLRQQIAATLRLEEQVWQHNDIAHFRRLLDAQAQPGWRSEWSMPWGIQLAQRTTLGVRITDIEAQEDMLLVQTVVNQPLIAWWRTTPYRELRFYRRTPAGWLRTAPVAADWGPVRTLATPHLQFQFYERDTPTILEMSVELELAYRQLYQVLERPLPTTPLTLTFAIVPDQMRELRMSDEPLRFASPLLLKAALELSDVEYATHLVISHLADRALLEILGPNRRQQTSRWRNMLWGASGRLRLEVLGERSPWQQEAKAFFQQTNRGQRPLRLTDIDDRYTGMTLPREAYLWEYMAAESLIAYLVQRHGWEGVIALFHGFGHSSYWSKVIPSVFGQSAADLEADWNRYLIESYANPESDKVRG